MDVYAERMKTAQEQVARGAALLDRVRPGWWEEESGFDPDMVSLTSERCCPLGQVFGTFDKGLAVVGFVYNGAHSQEVTDHGFDPPWQTREETEEVWAALVRQRREAAKEPRSPLAVVFN